MTQVVDKYVVVHFVKRLGKVKVNDIVVIAIQKTLDDVVNVLEEMSEQLRPLRNPCCLLLSMLLDSRSQTSFFLITRSKTWKKAHKV